MTLLHFALDLVLVISWEPYSYYISFASFPSHYLMKIWNLIYNYINKHFFFLIFPTNPLSFRVCYSFVYDDSFPTKSKHNFLESETWKYVIVYIQSMRNKKSRATTIYNTISKWLQGQECHISQFLSLWVEFLSIPRTEISDSINTTNFCLDWHSTPHLHSKKIFCVVLFLRSVHN